ncbi:MAG TPA: gas vesicle protein GvpJ [Mycobacteriales bacterium]
MADTNLALDDGSLVDLLDRLVDTGVVLDGNVLITLAGVDLIRLDLCLLLASIQSLSRSVPPGPGGRPLHRQHGLRESDGRPRRPPNQRVEPPVGPPAGSVSGPGAPAGIRRGRLSLLEDLDQVADPDRPSDPDRHRDLSQLTVPDRKADPAAGVAGLVVAVVDIVRQLLERQALRRMDAGTLSAAQIERLGRALDALERQVHELSELLGTRRSARLTEAPGGFEQPALPTHTTRGAR